MEREARMKEEYGKFLAQMEEFIFAEKKPEKADIIFVPGNGYPQMAEKAAQLYRQGLAAFVLPSGRYSVAPGITTDTASSSIPFLSACTLTSLAPARF